MISPKKITNREFFFSQQIRTALSFTNAAKPSVVFIQSTLIVQVPLMCIVIKRQLVEDGQ